MRTEPYTYVVVRSDIPLQHQAVQACHAALEAGFQFDKPDQVSNLILLHVGSESDLLELSRQLHCKAIQHHVFFEPDNAMGHSALCTKPVFSNRERRVFEGLELFNGQLA